MSDTDEIRETVRSKSDLMFNGSPAIKTQNEKCNQCGVYVSFLDIQKYGLRRPNGEVKCVECVGVFESAYRALQQGVTKTYLPNIGKATMRCQGWCNRTLEEIWRIDRTHSMFLHFKDGEEAMLCPQCSDRFSALATDLYKRTAFQAKGSVHTPYQRFKQAFDRFVGRGGRIFGR